MYLSGNVAESQVTFTVTETGDVIDPTTVTCVYILNGVAYGVDGETTAVNGVYQNPFVYSGASSPALLTIARISEGVYQFNISTTGMQGQLTIAWYSTGTGQAAVLDTITVGQTTGSGGTFGDLIENVFRRIQGPVQEAYVQVNETSGVGSYDETITFAGPQSAMVQPGVKLSIDLEDMSVISVSGQVATVQRGYGGSLPATHANGAFIYLNSRVSRFDVGVAINDDLNDLSARGLFRVGVSDTITYNPVFQGYDLGSLPQNFDAILEVSYRTIAPYRGFPKITRFGLRNWNTQTTDPAFPSGRGLILYEPAQPGMPLQVVYSAPFVPLVLPTDSLFNTPAVNDQFAPVNGYPQVTVPNLWSTMADIPPLGATAALIQPQEISRNDMGAEPDPRKAPEVPPQAITSSVTGMLARREVRISGEANRLYARYPNQVR